MVPGIFRKKSRAGKNYQSSNLRSANPTATENSGPISLSVERINSGAFVFANGSATRVSTAKNVFAYCTSPFVTPPPPVRITVETARL